MKKGWIILGLVVILGTGCMEGSSPSSNKLETPREDIGLTEAACSDAGGTWNPCGSACRTDPDAICIELCVEYCECTTDFQCPTGYTCGDFVDDVGVCL